MPEEQIENPFDSIESAYEFMDVLAETILLNMKDLHRDCQIALQEGQTRRAQAIEMALFKAKTLNCYVCKCRRTLNDLRTIRRLILNERMTSEAVVASVQTM